MKPYEELARLGQLRRARQLAEVALHAYGLNGARLIFVQYTANIVYRVDVPGPASRARGVARRGWSQAAALPRAALTA